jgi:hypothetical protein
LEEWEIWSAANTYSCYTYHHGKQHIFDRVCSCIHNIFRRTHFDFDLAVTAIFVTIVYGPIAAFLVEMFPTKIRYTSMSLPYHIGNGALADWFHFLQR